MKHAGHAVHAVRAVQVLNVLSAFCSTMDAQRLQHVPLLVALGPQVGRAAQQLGECLRVLQAVAQGRLAPSR